MRWPFRKRERRTDRHAPTSGGGTPLTAFRAFEIAYGRSPSSGEAEQLVQLCVPANATDTGLLRLVLAGFDHQRLVTPITVRFAETDLETVNCGGFRLVIDRCDFAVSRAIMDCRDYEPHLSKFVRRWVRPGMTAIDIGANVGFYSMLFGDLVGSSGRVLAFEPNSENCRLLLLSIAANGYSHVRLYPFALSQSLGALCFTSHLGSNGGLLPSTGQTITQPNCIVIPSVPLDAIVSEPVDFIKIDIEGAEYLALSGAEQLIRRHHPIITAEFSLEMLRRVSGIEGPEFLGWMKSLGYRLYVLRRDGAGIEAIPDIAGYLSGWGSALRIEDIAFVPEERTFDPTS